MEKKTEETTHYAERCTEVVFPKGLDTHSWKTLEDATGAICRYQNIGAITIKERDELLAQVLRSDTLKGPRPALFPIIRWRYKPEQQK